MYRIEPSIINMFPVEWTLYVLYNARCIISRCSCCFTLLREISIDHLAIYLVVVTFKACKFFEYSHTNIIGNVSLQVNLYQDNQNNWPLGKKKHFCSLYHTSVTSMSLVVTPKRILPRRKRLAVCGVNSALFSCGQWHASHDKFQSLHANLSLAVRRWFS